MKPVKSFEGIKTPDYSYYRMNNNPFRSVPISTDKPPILVDRDDVWQEIHQVVRRTLKPPYDSETYLVLGGYGIGKTHLLKYVRSAINTTFRNDRVVPGVAAYVAPGKSLYDFYTSLVADLGENFLGYLSRKIIGRFPDIPQNVSDSGQTVMFQKRVASQVIIDMWQRLDDDERKSTDLDFFSAIVNVNDEPKRGWSMYWLQGGNLSPTERARIGVQTITTKDNALESIKAFIGLLKVAGYKNVYILFDQLENVSYMSPERARTEYFDQLRKLYDELSHGFSLFYACTPEGWDSIEKYHEAFQTRARGLFGPRTLIPFSVDEAFELVRGYLKEERRQTALAQELQYKDLIKEIESEIKKKRMKIEDTELFPFSSEVVGAIQKEASGNVREILRLCGALIEKGYDSNQVFDDPSTVLSRVH